MRALVLMCSESLVSLASSNPEDGDLWACGIAFCNVRITCFMMFISCFPQTWFQNQRILNPEHREEPMNLSDGTNGVPHPTAQEQHIRLVPPPACCFPSSKPCCNEQMSLPAPLESQAFVPPGSVGVFGSPESGTATLQAPEAVQEGQNPDAPLTYTNHLPEQPIIGQGSSGAQAPFCSQLDADHGRQQPEDPDHIDVSYVMQWWDKGRLDLIAKWEPQKET